MSVKVNFPYKPGFLALYFVVVDENLNYLNKATGLFENWTLADVAYYKNTLTEMSGPDNGLYNGVVPIIVPQSVLPLRVKILVFDPATELTDGPIGASYVDIDKNENEIRYDLLLNYVFASTVGHNLGVGTGQEQYFGYDGFLAFTTTFDPSGNRQVVLAQG